LCGSTDTFMFPSCFRNICLSSNIHKHSEVFCGQVDVAFIIKSTTASSADICIGRSRQNPLFNKAYYSYY
jgi:hypothetical protein